VGSNLLPTQIIDVPNRRSTFDLDNKMRLLTKGEPVNGLEVDPYKFVLTRHMPSAENPFGAALFSSCYWPYIFKHGGFKFFYKFCERYGSPWPIGKYPAGTDIKGQNELLDALISMLEDGAAVVPEGDAVDLVEVKHSGELAQESLIHLCNREMSKALTSQTLATEMRNVGSNAASKTHSERQQDVQQSDRNMIAATMNEILRWITLFNFGPDTAAPRFEFFKPKDISDIRLKSWDTASKIGRPSRKAFHEELNIPEAIDDDDLLAPSQSAPSSPPTNFNRCGSCGEIHDFAGSQNQPLVDSAVDQANQTIENDWLKPAVDLLAEFEAAGKSLEQYQAALPKLYSDLDDSALIDITNQALQLAAAEGIEEAAD
jgi:phage gp29-like protein